MSKPTPKRIFISCEVPGKLYKDLMRERNLSHISLSDIIRTALYEYLEREQERRAFGERFPTRESYEKYNQMMAQEFEEGKL